MIFYHGTKEYCFKKILEEGVLWGYRGKRFKRVTFLTTSKPEAQAYGDVLLEVEYTPSEKEWDGTTHVLVTEPIPLSNVKRIK